MTDPWIVIQLASLDRPLAPGEALGGDFTLHDFGGAEVRAIELSILWYTEGKGEEELGVHYFERVVPADVTGFDVAVPRPFSVKLPFSPLSYDGVIVNIRWCVRVRVFLQKGRDIVAESPFQLGGVPPARGIAT